MRPKHAKTATPLAAEQAAADHLERIRQRAYELWEASGCPQGCDMQHWLQAENELSVLCAKPPPPGSSEIRATQ